LDVEKFQACLNIQQHQATLNQSLTQAGQLGLRFTPSVIVDGTLLEDSSLANVKAQIDAALATKGQ
jgi:protein-disulfide isomerase